MTTDQLTLKRISINKSISSILPSLNQELETQKELLFLNACKVEVHCMKNTSYKHITHPEKKDIPKPRFRTR